MDDNNLVFLPLGTRVSVNLCVGGQGGGCDAPAVLIRTTELISKRQARGERTRTGAGENEEEWKKEGGADEKGEKEGKSLCGIPSFR